MIDVSRNMLIVQELKPTSKESDSCPREIELTGEIVMISGT